MIVTEATAERAALLLRLDHPQTITGPVLLKALQNAEKELERHSHDQKRVCIPPYARRAMDDPRYQHGLSK